LLNLIAEIEEFKGAWRSLSTLTPDRLSSLKHVATIESIGSSTRIEGSKLSNKEVERLLAQLNIKQFDTRDKQEVAGYAELMDTVCTHWDSISVSENHLKQLHRDLLRYSEKDLWHAGNYKTSPNSVAAFDADGKQLGIIFQTASPFETPLRMTELVDWFNENKKSKQFHPLLAIAVFVVVFLEIHPFQDGNGRISRIITTLLLMQANYLYVPYSSLESVIETNKEAYYLALRQTQETIRSQTPNWNPWLRFFLQSLQRQVSHLKIKMQKEKLLLAALPELSLQILEHARNHGRITLRDAVTLTGANRNTLKQHFKDLLKAKQLELHGAGRGAWYSLP